MRFADSSLMSCASGVDALSQTANDIYRRERRERSSEWVAFVDRTLSARGDLCGKVLLSFRVLDVTRPAS